MNGLSVNEIEWIEGMEWNGLLYGVLWIPSSGFIQSNHFNPWNEGTEWNWLMNWSNERRVPKARERVQSIQFTHHSTKGMKVNGFNERSERAEGIGILTVSL